MVELAVFGSLFLLVLAALIRFGLATTYRQQLQQETFRKALATAGAFVSYQIAKDRMVPTPSGSFVLSPRSRVTAGSQVLWAFNLFAGKAKSANVIEINGDARTFSADDFKDVDKGGLQPDLTKAVDVDATLTRLESPSGVTTINDSTQKEKITSTIKTSSGNTSVVSTLTRSKKVTTATPFSQ